MASGKMQPDPAPRYIPCRCPWIFDDGPAAPGKGAAAGPFSASCHDKETHSPAQDIARR